MKNSIFSISVGVLACVAGCGGGGSGSTGAGGTTATGGTATTTTTGGTGGTGGSGGGTTTGSAGATTGSGGGMGAPLAPILTAVEKMEGALHVAWKNQTMNCDKIELERKHDDGAYAVAYTLTGAATSQHDTQALPPGMYCYKARCVLGMATSPESNELCGTP